MNEPSSVLKSDKLLIAIREKNETQAMKTVEDQIKNGLPHMLDDPLMEWKFYLVGLLTYITYFLNDSGVVENYYDHSRVEFTKEVYNAQSVEQCEEILRKIARFFSEREQEPERTLSPLVRKVITDVDTDLKEPLTLQYFSEKLEVNGSYLSNLFRRETGKTITQYVTDQRLKHAENLLRYTNKPVRSVAAEVGIGDAQYFSRLFRKKTGMKPTEYRRKYQSAADAGQPEE
jgi:YesN/AraC family two-component response regulator